MNEFKYLKDAQCFRFDKGVGSENNKQAHSA
nr:MAG TPA: hypothetical protein [Caudoviricetes sp.]